MTDRLISEEEVRALLRGNPELTPERIYGREAMAAWRARQDDIDRLALRAEDERVELEQLRASKTATSTTEQDKPGAPAKKEDPNAKYLDPATNPFIRPL